MTTGTFDTPERVALRQTVRRFMDAEVLPRLDEGKRAGELPREPHRRAGEIGLLGVAFPEEVGGGGLVGAENTGFVQLAAHFVTERLSLAVQAYATAQHALDLTLDWCRSRETVGSARISRQLVQHTLTEMARRIDVARTYVRGVAAPRMSTEDVVAEACFAKNTAVEAGAWVVDQTVGLHGGLGYMRESEVERHYRDMRILGIGGGTSEILTGPAAKRLGYTS